MKPRWLPYILVLPAITIVVGTLLLPVVNVVVMSVTEWYLLAQRAGGEGHPFVGLANYSAAFRSPLTWKALNVTGVFVVACVLIEIVGGLGAALLLNEEFRGRGVARTLTLIPFAMPVVPWALAWVVMLYYDGIINHMLMNLGLTQGNSRLARPVQDRPPRRDLRQSLQGRPVRSSDVSGWPVGDSRRAVRSRHRGWGIRVEEIPAHHAPAAQALSLVTTLILTVWHINDFAIVWVMTQGGPSNATELIVINAYKVAFEAFRFGESSAIGVALLVFSLLFGVLYLKSTRALE